MNHISTLTSSLSQELLFLQRKMMRYQLTKGKKEKKKGQIPKV
jgi:hypothetical protein